MPNPDDGISLFEILAAHGIGQPCSICGGTYEGFGNNAAPVTNGRCCDDCNTTDVIPARMKALFERLPFAPKPEEKK